jgi:hypothetical protein
MAMTPARLMKETLKLVFIGIPFELNENDRWGNGTNISSLCDSDVTFLAAT